MAWDLTVGGVSRKTEIAQAAGVTIRLESGERSSLSFQTKFGSPYRPSRFERVRVSGKTGAILFGGIVLSREVVTQAGKAGALPATRCECVDWWVYLDWSLVTIAFPGPVTTRQILAAVVAAVPAEYGFTMAAGQAAGRTYPSFASGVLARASEVIRGLAQDVGGRASVSPDLVVAITAPGSVAAPFTITDANPHCQEAGWRDGDGTPATRVYLTCGPAGIGEPVWYRWTGDGVRRVFALAGVAIPASSVFPSIAYVDGIPYPIWHPGEGPPDHMEWDYALNDGTLTFIGDLTPTPGAGVPVEILYSPQFPFVVSADSGGSPVISESQSDETITVYAQGVARAAAILAELNQPAARELGILSRLDGWRPDQALTVNLSAIAFAGVCTIGPVEITLTTDQIWAYRFSAVETTIVPGTTLDAWRKLLGRTVTGSSSATVGVGGSTGGGGGGMLALPAGQIYVGSAAGAAAAVPMSGDLTITSSGETTIAAGAIVDADIAATAAIADTKLATIATPGKVANSATSANTGPVANTIALRDGIGDLYARAFGAVVEVVSPIARLSDKVITPLVTSPAGPLKLQGFNGVVELSSTYGLETAYSSGFAGSGFSLSYNRYPSTQPNIAYFEVDRLTVRGTMNVYELLVHQIRATNGSIFVANTGRVKTVTAGAGVEWTVITEGDHGFAVGDLIRAQRFTQAGGGGGVFVSDLWVTAVASTTQFTANLQPSSTLGPIAGMDYVRLGSTASVDRQGSIYLTADDLNAPYINILSGVDSIASWGTAAKVRARLGNLNGAYGYTANTYGVAFGDMTAAHVLIDTVYGVRIRFGASDKITLDMSGNATFAGTVTAAAGAIGGFLIGATLIRDTANTFGLESTETAGNDVRFWAGTDWTNRANAPFRVYQGGEVFATAGAIGGWSLLSHYLYSTMDGNAMAFDSTRPSLEMGNPRPLGYADGHPGVWMGRDTDGFYKFRVSTGDGTAGMFFDGSVATFRGNGTGVTQINGANIQTGTVTANQIMAETITGNQIAARAIGADRIVVGTLTGNEMKVRSIDGDRINVTALSAIVANLGAITAGSITSVAILSGTINGTTITGVTISGSTIRAGSSNEVVMDASGITIAAGGFTGSRIKWTDGTDIGSGGNQFSVRTNDGMYVDVPTYFAVKYLAGSGNRSVYVDGSGSLRAGGPVLAFDEQAAASVVIQGLIARVTALEGGAT